MITFEDGRMVQLSRGSSVWQLGQSSAIAPGTQVFVRGAPPTGFRSAWNSSTTMQHRMGTVVNIDPASALIVMSDGSVVKVSPATKVQSGSDALRLTDLQPGDEVVLIGKPIVASSGANGSGMASPGTHAGARAQSGGSQAIRAGSLPAFYNATFDASEIHIVRKHQAP